MGDLLYYSGAILGAVAFVGAVGMLGGGSIILICFIAGECQRIGRKRAAKKKLVLEKGFEHLKARDEIAKRERRLTKEREARKSMWEDDTIPLVHLQGSEYGSE